MTKYLIWDFDGTLGYRIGMWTETVIDVLQQTIPESNVSREQLRPFLQSGFPWHHPDYPHPEINTSSDWWNSLDSIFERTLMQGAGLEHQQAQILAKQVRNVYPDPTHWRLYDDTVPTLEALSNTDWKHLILSNHVPELKDILTALKIGQYFEKIFNSAETGYEKPHPQAFQNVLNTVNSYSAIWMIGDSLKADIMGAKNLGIPGILVRKHHLEATVCCENLTQLLDIISKNPQ